MFTEYKASEHEAGIQAHRRTSPRELDILNSESWVWLPGSVTSLGLVSESLSWIMEWEQFFLIALLWRSDEISCKTNLRLYLANLLPYYGLDILNLNYFYCKLSEEGHIKVFKNLKTFLQRATFCLVAKSCPTLCNPMDCNMPGFPVSHHLPIFAQIHVHCIRDAIQPSHPLLPFSPAAFNLSQLCYFTFY